MLPLFSVRFRFRKLSAFTLVEVLSVLVILGILTASMGVLFSSSWIAPTSPAGAVRHGEYLGAWLEGKILESRLRGEGFLLSLPSASPRDSLRISWNIRSLTETWEGRGYFFRAIGVPQSRFSLPLGTFTPTFTLDILTEKKASALGARITVSLYGKITVRDMEP